MTDTLRGPLLAAIAGFVDTVTFVGLHGLFAAHVTGNFVLIGAALVLGTGGIAAKLATFPVFMLAVLAARLASRRTARPARRLLLAKTALLAAFAILAVTLGPFADPDGWRLILAAAFAVAAMGVQNALMRIAYPGIAPTTIMTGNTTGLMLDLADRLAGVADAPARARLARLGWTIGGFALGCAAGAAGYAVFGFAALLAPVAVQLALLAGAAGHDQAAAADAGR